MARGISILIVVAALVVAVSAGGLQADEGKDEERVVIRYDGPLPIEHFLKQTAEALDLPLVWDPKSRALQNKEVVGEIKLQGTREEILDGVRGLLTYYELVLIPVGSGPNRKILVMDARQTAAIVKLKPTFVTLSADNLDEWAQKDGTFITTTIQVEHMANLRDARNALNRIVTGQNIGNVTEVPPARSFVVTDFAPNVVSIYRLLKSMDVPFAGEMPESAGREVIFQAIRLKHASAETVASTLVQMHGVAAAPAPRRAVPQQQSGGDVPPTPVLSIQPDERLNQVLVSGMRQDVDRVIEALKSMDQPKPQMTAQIQFIRLQHIDATGAAVAINNLVRRFPIPWLDETGDGLLPAVEAHPETNGLLLHAGQEAATALRRLISEMDQAKDGGEGGGEGGGG